MMNLLKQIIALIVLGCLFIVLFYIIGTVIVVALIVGVVAAVYFSIRMFFIRKKLREAMREYQAASYSDAYRTNGSAAQPPVQGDIIEVEYTEVTDEKKD